MKHELSTAAAAQLDALTRAIDRNTAALEAANETFMPPKPLPATCCEHGIDCTRSTQ